MTFNPVIAVTSFSAQRGQISNDEGSMAGLQDTSRFEGLDHAACIAAANVQHAYQLLMSERDGLIPGPVEGPRNSRRLLVCAAAPR